MGVWSWNFLTDDAVLDAAEYELLGYDHASPHAPRTGKEFFKLVHPDDRERLVQKFERTAQYQESFYDEFRIVRPDGAVRWPKRFSVGRLRARVGCRAPLRSTAIRLRIGRGKSSTSTSAASNSNLREADMVHCDPP
jgi:PAS domain-containing protein